MASDGHDGMWQERLKIKGVRRSVRPTLRRNGVMVRLGSAMIVDFDILCIEIWRTREEERDGKMQYVVLYTTSGPMRLEEFGLSGRGVAFQWRILRECSSMERAIYTLEARLAGWVNKVIEASPWLNANWEFHLVPRLRNRRQSAIAKEELTARRDVAIRHINNIGGKRYE